jgi:hypothetical protein
MELKVCNKCGIEKAEAEFYVDSRICKPMLHCRACHQRPWSSWSQQAKEAHNQRKFIGRVAALPGYKPSKHDGHVREWKRSVRDQRSAHSVERMQLQDAHVKEWRSCPARMARWRTANDAAYRLNMRLRVQVRKALKGRKAGRSWERLLGYSLEDLMCHFGRMLPKGVTLDRAFEQGWHIDHIVPKSTYNLADESELKSAWCMSNLRLVPAEVNMRKSAKRETML